MSTLNVNKIADASGGVLAPISSVMRNRLINGSFTIDQRNAGASVTPTSVATYTLDRWLNIASVSSKFSVQQSSTVPSGFVNSALMTSLSAYTVGASEAFTIGQRLEGYNVSDLGWGTANAKTVTLSFWVRSSLTGTFGGSLRNGAADRSYPFSYVISSANTWEQKSINIVGDTSGTWLTTSGIGINLSFSIGTGSSLSGTAGSWQAGSIVSVTGATSVVGTNGATFYITGVQLEVGTQATSFEYRQYQQELALCQRYLPAWRGTSGVQAQGQAASGTLVYIPLQHPVQTRTAPTGITSTSTNTIVSNSSGSGVAVTSLAFVQSSNMSTFISATVSSGVTAGNASFLIFNDGNLFLTGCEL
jgi:hypothetical protein